MSRTYGQHCGLARALDRIGERWTLLIVRELLLGPARYTDLRQALPGLATNLLADRLRALQAEGIVARRRLPPPAATTVYELTEMGRGLDEAVNALIRWGGHWMREPEEGDMFRPQWLLLAVRALSRPAGVEGLPLTCAIEVAAEAFTLAIDERGVAISVGTDPRAEITLRTDPQTLLAVASGARPLGDAIRSGAVEAEGDPEAVRTLAAVWDPRALSSPVA